MTAAKPRIRVRATANGQVLARTPVVARDSVRLLTTGGSRRDAARSDIPELQGWNPGPGFSGSSTLGDSDTILGRARDLDRNNPWINGGLDRRVEAVIGGTIRLSAQPITELLNRDFAWRMKWIADVQPRFRAWGNDIERRCDARGVLSFGQIIKLAYLTYARDGECAAEIRDTYRGLANPTNVLLFEPERISTPRYSLHREGPGLRNGVVMDEKRGVVGYWVKSTHPDDMTPSEMADRWEYVPRFGPTGRHKLLHVFSPRYAEQNRGVSRLAEAMVSAKMLDRVDRAEVQAALKSAVMSFFIKSPGTTDDLEAAFAPSGSDVDSGAWIDPYLEYRSKSPIRLEASQFVHLLPDEDVVAPEATRPNANYPEFARFVLQKIAGSLGISYPQLSQDWAGINYSSARALLNELWRSFLEDRVYFTQQFCTPIYAAWLEREVANGDVKVPGGAVNFLRNKTAICMAEWIGPGRGSVDPLKEANADNLDIAGKRKSTVEAILERGRDPSDLIAEEAWFLAECVDKKLDPPNHNVKADGAAGSDGSGSGASEQDRDGDGIPLEDKKPKKKATAQ